MTTLDLFANPERISETPRARELCRLDAYLRGTQYDGRPDWFEGVDNNGEVVPLRERKPCVIYALPDAAVSQAVRFAVGEGRFPGVVVDEIEEAEAIAPGLTVTGDEAEALTALVAACIENICLKTASRMLMRTGLSVKTAPAILSVRRGKFALDMPRPQDCWPKFVDDDPTADVLEMVWCYQFDKPVEQGGSFVPKPHLFRRDITAEYFITYEDAPIEHGKAPEWTPKETKPHGLGFCPVVWARNMPESHCSDIDGTSLYGTQLDEFDALNFSLSQRHRGIHYFGTPQAYETDVGSDEAPAAVGRTARALKGGEKVDAYFHVNPKRARKAAPDQIWSYQGKANLGVLETSGKAFEVATKHVLDIRARILEVLNVVLLDPETAMKQDLAGVALQRLFSPMLAMVDELREHWWEHCITKIISMMLRVIAVTGGKGLLIPGAAKMAPMLGRFNLRHEGGTVWCPPKMTPAWGDYFSASPEDIKAGVDAAEKAKTAGLISGATATRYVAPYFGVEDAEQEHEDAEAESLEAAQATLDGEIAKAEATAEATPKVEVEEPEPTGRGVEKPEEPVVEPMKPPVKPKPNGKRRRRG